MICAICGEPVALDGPLGYVHEDGQRIGEDPFRHTVVGIKKASPTPAST
jgi:hypothetical protein